MQKTRTLINRE